MKLCEHRPKDDILRDNVATVVTDCISTVQSRIFKLKMRTTAIYV